MGNVICTISTVSHIEKSFALARSLDPETNFHMLLMDVREFITTNVHLLPNVHIDFLDQLIDNRDFKAVSSRFAERNDKLRWALKPVYLKFLLESGYDRAIYVDNDIFFYASPDFLFEKLNQASFLLTPHFYKADPTRDQHWFEANFRVGLYNAGFIGVSQKGIPILDWWANCCLYNVKKAYWRGLFDDQKYLDLVPILFDEVEILKHKGCNLAGWNYQNYQLSRDEEHQLLVNGDPLVFIHFAALSLQEFSSKDSPLNPEFEIYLSALKKMNPAFDGRVSKFESRNLQSFLYFLRWRLIRLLEKKR